MAWVEQRGSQWRVRFRHPDGTVGTDSSHPSRPAAELRCKQVDIDQAYDTYLDPAAGRITLADWVTIWEPGHDVGPAKWAAYHSHLRNHILPRFGHVPLTKITRQAVKVFVKDLKRDLAESSVASIMSLFNLLMREAVADRRIGINPSQGVRVLSGQYTECPAATTAQVDRIADRIGRRSDQILVITAAYTGMRWGELAGLAKINTHLGDGPLSIDPQVGALHEVRGQLYLGPPKTAASVRDIHLPPFLTDLLQEVMDSHEHQLVFCGAHGAELRRSSMSRRVWRPAVNGNPAARTGPIIENMHFHDLRHTHKTWLIEDDIPRDRPSPTARPPTARRTRHLQPRHTSHDRPHHQRLAGPLAGHPQSQQPACAPSARRINAINAGRVLAQATEATVRRPAAAQRCAPARHPRSWPNQDDGSDCGQAVDNPNKRAPAGGIDWAAPHLQRR